MLPERRRPSSAERGGIPGENAQSVGWRDVPDRAERLSPLADPFASGPRETLAPPGTFPISFVPAAGIQMHWSVACG